MIFSVELLFRVGAKWNGTLLRFFLYDIDFRGLMDLKLSEDANAMKPCTTSDIRSSCSLPPFVPCKRGCATGSVAHLMV